MNKNIKHIVEEFDFDQIKMNKSNVFVEDFIDYVHSKIVNDENATLTNDEWQVFITNLKSKQPRLFKVSDSDQLEQIVENLYGRTTYVIDGNKFYLPLNFNWLDVSNVTELDMIFCDMDDSFSAREQHVEENRTIICDKWNVKNVKSMSGLFNSCEVCLNTDISNWDVLNCLNFDKTFAYCNMSQDNINKIKRKWHINPNASTTDMFKER